MSEFVYVVGAALAILVVGGILSGFVPQSDVASGPSDTTTVFFEQLGTIGALDAMETSSRDINLGSFVVNETSPESTEYMADRLTVQSSTFSDSRPQIIEFDAVRPQSAELSFIPETNAPAEDLLLTVNGESVDVPELTSGDRVTVSLSQDVLHQGNNVIQLSARDPGMAFWNGRTYRLRNVEVTLTDLKNDRVLEPFRVHDYEVNGFDHGELQFSVGPNAVRDEELDIRINGNTIASRLPVTRPAPYTVNFFANTTGLQFGENVISFKTGGDSYYPLNNVRIRLFFHAGNEQRTVVREFQLDESTHTTLGKENWEGKMSFNVDRIFVERPVTIDLTDRSYTFTPQPGENTRTFGQDALAPGQNTLKLTTDGSYRITDFNMSLVKTE